MMRALLRFVTLALLVFSTCVHAQTSVGAGAVDPFVFSYTGLNYPPTCDNLGRSPTSLQGVDTTKKNLVIITAPAQSNWINTAPSAFTPVNAAKIDNLNICNGGIYPVSADPLLGVNCKPGASPSGCATPGCTTSCLGNVATRIADTLITNAKFDRVIIAPAGVGSTSIAMWAPGGALAQTNSRIAAVLGRLAAKGIKTTTTNVTIIGIVGIGETDCGLGTSQVSWVASFNSVLSAAGSLATGMRWFVAKESWNGSISCAAVQSAQTAASPSGVINNAAGIYLGPDVDALQGNVCNGASACRQSDSLHATDAMNVTLAANTITALSASGAPF